MTETPASRSASGNPIFLFFSRVIFFFNLLFAGWYLLVTFQMKQMASAIVNFLGVITFFTAPVANVILSVCFAYLLFTKRLQERHTLYFVNLLFLILIWGYLLSIE